MLLFIVFDSAIQSRAAFGLVLPWLKSVDIRMFGWFNERHLKGGTVGHRLNFVIVELWSVGNYIAEKNLDCTFPIRIASPVQL